MPPGLLALGAMVILLARALALAAVSTALGLGYNAVRPQGVALRTFSPPTACGVPGTGAATAADGIAWVEVLPPAQAVRLCGDQGVLVADARPATRFAEGHVAGALHLPCAASSSEATSAMARMHDKHTVIVYGDSTAEARPVAEDLRRRAGRPGLRMVVLEGGFSAWSTAGLACSSGPCPHCAEQTQSQLQTRPQGSVSR